MSSLIAQSYEKYSAAQAIPEKVTEADAHYPNDHSPDDRCHCHDRSRRQIPIHKAHSSEPGRAVECRECRDGSQKCGPCEVKDQFPVRQHAGLCWPASSLE